MLKRGYGQCDYLFNTNVTLSIATVRSSLLEKFQGFRSQHTFMFQFCSGANQVSYKSVFLNKKLGRKKKYEFNPLKTNVNLH
jgi:hypothetical protein